MNSSVFQKPSIKQKYYENKLSSRSFHRFLQKLNFDFFQELQFYLDLKFLAIFIDSEPLEAWKEELQFELKM